MKRPTRPTLSVAVTAIVLATATCSSRSARLPEPFAEPSASTPAIRTLWVSTSGRDTNPGTRERPLREVDRAADLATPGTVVHVAPGSYKSVTSDRDGIAGRPITFVSDKRWQATIQGAGGITAWANGADWVVISGFEVVGSTYNGILTTGSHGRFLGNHIHDVIAPTCKRGGAGIVAESYTAQDNDTVGNVLDHIRAPGDCGRVHGIYYQSPNGGRIINNVVYATSGWGIHLWHNARDITITNNTVVQNAQGGIAVGGSLEGNDLRPGRASGVVVTNNLVVDNGRAGIIELGRVGDNTYADNLVHGNKSSGYLLQHGDSPTGTITADPGFVDQAAGDFHLRPTSPARDSGTALGAPDTDLEGTARPQGVWIDIGAFESAD